MDYRCHACDAVRGARLLLEIRLVIPQVVQQIHSAFICRIMRRDDHHLGGIASIVDCGNLGIFHAIHSCEIADGGGERLGALLLGEGRDVDKCDHRCLAAGAEGVLNHGVGGAARRTRRGGIATCRHGQAQLCSGDSQ